MGMWTVDTQRIHDCTETLLLMNSILGVVVCSHFVMGDGVRSESQVYHRAVAVLWDLCIVKVSVLQFACTMKDCMCSHQAHDNVYSSVLQCSTHQGKSNCAKHCLL